MKFFFGFVLGTVLLSGHISANPQPGDVVEGAYFEYIKALPCNVDEMTMLSRTFEAGELVVFWDTERDGPYYAAYVNETHREIGEIEHDAADDDGFTLTEVGVIETTHRLTYGGSGSVPEETDISFRELYKCPASILGIEGLLDLARLGEVVEPEDLNYALDVLVNVDEPKMLGRRFEQGELVIFYHPNRDEYLYGVFITASDHESMRIEHDDRHQEIVPTAAKCLIGYCIKADVEESKELEKMCVPFQCVLKFPQGIMCLIKRAWYTEKQVAMGRIISGETVSERDQYDGPPVQYPVVDYRPWRGEGDQEPGPAVVSSPSNQVSSQGHGSSSDEMYRIWVEAHGEPQVQPRLERRRRVRPLSLATKVAYSVSIALSVLAVGLVASCNRRRA